MTASTLAIALAAPFTGAVADVLGRKRMIAVAMLAVVVPMVGASFAADVQALIAWRFVQGLLLPPIFGVIVAYIGDEWPPVQVAGVAGSAGAPPSWRSQAYRSSARSWSRYCCRGKRASCARSACRPLCARCCGT